jgi:hypothetical protein
MTTYFLIDRKNPKNRNNYDFISSSGNGSHRVNAIPGGVPTPLSLIASERNVSKNNSHSNNSNSKLKKTVGNNSNTQNDFNNSPVLQQISRYPVKNADIQKRADPIPSYNQPKPIITDMERHGKLNKSPLINTRTIAEEPLMPEQSFANKGDAWEKLKELSSSVPPPPPENDHLVSVHQIQRPLTIISPTGVQETNLDDITPPLPPRDHSNSRPRNSSLPNKYVSLKDSTHDSNTTNTPLLLTSPTISQKTNSLAETNRATIQSQDSLDDIDTTQATSTRAAGRPSSVDESSIYHSSSSSSGVAPITDAETTYGGGLTRTDLDTPSPAFNRNSGGSASLQWVYPNPENPSESEHSFIPTHNRDDFCIFIKRSNNDLFGSRKKKTDSSAQTDGPQLNPKKHYHHVHHHNHSHHFHHQSNPNTQNLKHSNLKCHSGSYKSDGSSGTNSARRRHRNNKRDRSKDDDDINVPLLSSKHSFIGRTAASDTEEEFDLTQRGAVARKSHIDFVTRSPSFGSNSSRSQRKGSLPDYYKSSAKYGKIMPKRLPSLESVSKQSSRDFGDYSPKLRSKGSLPMIPLQELKNVNEVLAEFGVRMNQKERVKQDNEFCMRFEEEDEKSEAHNNQDLFGFKFNSTHNKPKTRNENQSELEIIQNRAKNAKGDTLIDMAADLVDLEDQLDNPSRPLAFRFPLEDIDITDAKKSNQNNRNNNSDCDKKISSNFNRLSHRKHAKESEYENLDSDVPYYEGDAEDDEEEPKDCDEDEYDNNVNVDELASDDSDEVHSEDKSFDETNRLFETNCDESVAGLDGMSVFNDAGLTDAEGALSDVNSLLNDPGHDADMDDTSMSSRSGASSRMFDNIDSVNLMYDSEFEYSIANRHNPNVRNEILSDDECFNVGPQSDIDVDYFESQHSANNLVTPTTLAERLENIRAITNNITRNFGQSKNDSFKSKANETDDSEA